MDKKFEQILTTSMALFDKYGIRSVSMDDICREMAISKKTLYQYVDSKGDLVGHLLDYVSDRVGMILSEASDQHLNAIETLLFISKRLGKLFKELKSNRGAEFDLKKYYGEIYTKHCEGRNQTIIQFLTDNLEQGIREGLYRKDLSRELIANLFMKKIEDISDPEFFSDGRFSFKKIHKVMIESHIRGISNQNGLEYFENRTKTR
jgi:AcrR family transcriptional regulator